MNYFSYLRYRVVILFCLIFCMCTQPSFEEDEIDQQTEKNASATTENGQSSDYSELHWEGDMNLFRFDKNGTIRLYDERKQAGQASIASPLTLQEDNCWDIKVKLSFNPSANNHTYFYLTASSAQLETKELHGYYLQIGGKEDRIYLFRQNGNTHTLICQTSELMKGNSSPEIHIIVMHDHQGYLTLRARTLEKPWEFIGPLKDEEFIHESYCGIRCIYTASNSKKIRFTSIHIHHNVDNIEVMNPD